MLSFCIHQVNMDNRSPAPLTTRGSPNHIARHQRGHHYKSLRNTTKAHQSSCARRNARQHSRSRPEGGIFCAKHALPPAEHCASCGETELELWPDEDAEARYFKQFHYFERQHYCEWCWNEWIERPQPTHDASAETECGVCGDE